MLLTLSHDGASSDTVGDISESRVQVQHLGWLSLVLVRSVESLDLAERSKVVLRSQDGHIPLNICSI